MAAIFALHDAVRPTAEIDGCGGEGFVHRHQEISGAQNPALVAERLDDGFAEGDASVFDGVVLVDVEVALRFELRSKAP